MAERVYAAIPARTWPTDRLAALSRRGAAAAIAHFTAFPSEVALRDSKSKLSTVIRRARAGESMAVTSHCMPIGRLLPRTPTSGGSLPERLPAAGAISELPRRGGLGPRQPGPLLAGDAGTLSDAACDDRR